jgi:ubiquinone/menaquinone biosynthesis C-methylase UbiE
METLERKIGEGSFVGFKKPKTPEEIVEYFKHIYAYKYASDFVENKLVLDLGCGVGYGTNELSNKASLAIGIDIWKEGIRYAHKKYNQSHFLIASALNLPFRDSCFNIVTSFQVIEHIEKKNVIQYLHEIKRVLKNGGMLIISTPNRKLRLLPFQKPWNPDHKKEYDAKELDRIIKKVFKNFKILGLFATKKTYLVEYYRVKQNPLFIYVLNPLSYIMKRFTPNIFLQTMKRIIAGKADKSVYNRFIEISIEDFNLSHKYLESCIDLYGICIKEIK